jgi:hypothetical protein
VLDVTMRKQDRWRRLGRRGLGGDDSLDDSGLGAQCLSVDIYGVERSESDSTWRSAALRGPTRTDLKSAPARGEGSIPSLGIALFRFGSPASPRLVLTGPACCHQSSYQAAFRLKHRRWPAMYHPHRTVQEWSDRFEARSPAPSYDVEACCCFILTLRKSRSTSTVSAGHTLPTR